MCAEHFDHRVHDDSGVSGDGDDDKRINYVNLAQQTTEAADDVTKYPTRELLKYAPWDHSVEDLSDADLANIGELGKALRTDNIAQARQILDRYSCATEHLNADVASPMRRWLDHLGLVDKYEITAQHLKDFDTVDQYKWVVQLRSMPSMELIHTVVPKPCG